MKNKKIIYCLKVFPAVTTTFILNEMWLLKQKGWDIKIVCQEKGAESVVHARAREFDDKVIYCDKVLSFQTLKAHLYFLFNHPIRYLSIAFNCLFLRIFPCHLAELIIFLQSVPLAYALRHEDNFHIHAHFCGSTATSALILGHLLRKDFSFIAHAVALFVYENAHSLKNKVRMAKFVLTVSEFHRNFIENKCQETFGGKISILKSSIIPDDFTQKTLSSNSLPSLLTVCRFVEKKGLKYLIEAYGELKRKDVAFSALLIGEGPLENDLKALISQFQLQDHVKMRSFVSQKDIADYYLNADIFVLPCIVASNGDIDGMPYSLAEVMSMGLCTVSTTVSGIPELIENKKTGFLVPQKDSSALSDMLQELIAHPEECREVGQAAKKYILEKHDLTKNINLLENAILN